MIGFILAAGYGTRLRPLTDHLPKALVTVGGEPLLGHALRRVAGAAPSRILVNTHAHAEAISAYRARSQVDFEISHEREICGTGGAIHAAREVLALDPTFCVTNADILCPIDLGRLHEAFLASGAAIGLLADLRAPKGTIFLEPESLAYRGVPAEGAAPAGSAPADFVGMAFYRREVLELIGAEDFSIVPVWKRAAEAGLQVQVLPIGEVYWRDLGRPESLLAAHVDILHGRLPLSQLPSGLQFDRQGRRCWPLGMDGAGIGADAWVEVALPASTRAERCLILRGAEPEAQRVYRHTILTAWGEVPLGD